MKRSTRGQPEAGRTPPCTPAEDPHGGLRLAELAAALGREFEGAGDVLLSGVAELARAGPGDLAFVRSARYAEALATTRAGAVILPPGLAAGGRAAIRSPLPGLDFARAARRLVAAPRPEPGVHPSATVAGDAEVAASATLGPGACVGRRARVGARSVLHAGSVLYDGVVVGADCEIHARCVLREGTRLGDRVLLQPGAVLGGDGYGYVPDGEGGVEKSPQLGGVVVGDDVEIGANATVDRGSLGDTRIGRGAKLGDLVHVGHNCEIGEGVLILAQAGLSGSTRIARGAVVMGQAGTVGHLEIGECAVVGPQSGVTKSVPPRTWVLGSPHRSGAAHHRAVAALSRLPALLRRVRALERRLGLRSGGDGGDG